MSRRIFGPRQLVVLALINLVLAADSAELGSNPATSWGTYVRIESEAGAGRSEDAEVMAFIPIFQQQGESILFVDLRGVANSRYTDQSISLGLGYRKVVKDNLIVGVNGSIGQDESDSGAKHSQGQVGVEVLTEKAALALNFYFPLSGEKQIGAFDSYSARLTGNQAFIDGITQRIYEEGLNGQDLHMSFDLWDNGDTEFFFDGSVYHFGGGSNAVTGATAALRFEKEIRGHRRSGDFGGYLGIRKERGEDADPFVGVYTRVFTGKNRGRPYSHRTRGSFSISKELKRRLYEPVKRTSSVVTSQRLVQETYTVPATITVGEKTYDEIAASINNSQDLFDTATAAGANSLVVLDGERGSFVLNQLLDLQGNQSLVGGGTPVLLTGPQGQQAILILPGQGAVAVRTGNDAIRLTDSSQLINVDEVLLSGPVRNTHLTNGSFEEGHGLRPGRWGVFSEITGWMADLEASNAPIEIQRNRGGRASDGESFLELDSHNFRPYTNSNSHVYQDVDTEKGDTYRLSFDYSVQRRARRPNSDTVEVFWEGEKIATLNAPRGSGWHTTEVLVTANTPSFSRLEFRAAGAEDTFGGFIDNVKLERIDD